MTERDWLLVLCGFNAGMIVAVIAHGAGVTLKMLWLFFGLERGRISR
jgi:hypothetical protein